MRRRILTFAFAAALAAVARGGVAQTVQLRAGAWWLSSQDLAPGAGVVLAAPLSERWVLEGAWQRGVQYQAYRCLDSRGYCVPEVSRVRSTLYRAALAVRYPLLRGARWSAGASGGLGVARLYTTREWPGSPGGADYKITYALAQTGLELERQILASSPLRLVAAGRAALAIDPNPETITDGAPLSFWSHFALAGLELGIAWPLGGQSAPH